MEYSLNKDNNTFTCEIGVSKEDWLNILYDKECKQDYIDNLLRFLREPNMSATCKSLGDKYNIVPQSINSQVMYFGKLASKILDIKIKRFDDKITDTFWPIPMSKGENVENNLFKWTLRIELAEALRDWLLNDLVKSYKAIHKEKPFCGQDELYKWRGCTECKDKSIIDIISFIKHSPYNNLIYQLNISSLAEIAKNKPKELTQCVSHLYDDSIQLNERLSTFAKEISAICPNGKTIPKDERTASTLLTFHNFNRYTFYMFEKTYSPFCEYLGITKETGANKLYPHFLEILKPLVSIVDADNELKQMILESTPNCEQSNLLTAQTIIWCMKDKIEKKQTTTSMIPSEIQQYADILRIKKNLILQGAPGTGKTYNTASIALAICGQTDVDLSDHTAVMERYEKLRSEHQIEFATFHQSMDYEDFVEGIKPKVCDDNSMVYEVEDGIFKEISDKALQNQIDSKKTKQVLQQEKSIEEKLFAFLDDAISEGKVYKTKADSEFVITSYNEKSINFYNEKNPKTKDVSASIKETIAILNSDLKLEQVSEIKQFFGRKNGQQSDSYLYKICNDIRSAVTKIVDVQLVKHQNHVLIIDEINRGNVSKIFGELITLLEADKRIGSDHPITLALPYSKEQFGVPSNLYIIGTMNTTDRSVGNIDYAVRRRFAFATLKSDKSVLSEKHGVDSVNVRLYEAVEKFINSNLPNGEMGIDDLMVGHSYFMAEYEEDLQLKWKFEILPLLNEYYKDGIINKGVGNDVTIDEFLKLWQSANGSNAEVL